MRKELLDILACPQCKGPLTVSVEEEESDGDILTGALLCGSCQESYPIEESIPNLLPPSMRT